MIGYNKKIERIQLVHPTTNYAKSIHSAVVPPLGLVVIGSEVKKRYPSIELEILDGEILNQKKLEDIVDADLIGISVNQYNYSNGLNIAKIAKRKGSIVVLGGPHTNYLSSEILKNRPFVDYIVIFQGEKAFPSLIESIIKRKDLDGIKNLAYRGKEKIIIENIPLNNTNIIDFSIIQNQIPIYFSNFRKKFSEVPYKKPLPFYTQKGCRWGRCTFCCNNGMLSFDIKDPIRSANEIEYLVKIWETDYIIGMADNDFLADLNWVKSLKKELDKRNLNPGFKIETRANKITPESAKLLESLNVYEVFIGYESGNQKLLNTIKKGITLEQSRNSVRLLNEYGINILAGFMVGLPNETEKTLEDTIRFAEEISQYSNVNSVLCGIMTPRPGSEYFEKFLSNHKTEDKYLGKDIINVEEIIKKAVELFCKVSYKRIEEGIKEISSFYPKYRGFVGVRK